MIKFDTDTIRMISLFERITDLHVKDCIFSDDEICFLVAPRRNFRAVKISALKSLKERMKRNVKIFEWNGDMKRFIKNLIPQSKEINIKAVGDRKIASVRIDDESRGAVIGRNGKNIGLARKLLSRHCKIDDVKLIAH